VQTTDSLTYAAYTGAMASFVQTGDPNSHKLTNGSVTGVPPISEGKQFLVTKGEGGKAGIRQGGVDLLKRRCDFWLEKEFKVPRLG